MENEAKRGWMIQRDGGEPLPGMLVFQDASTHPWLFEGPPLDLVVTMDDATSNIFSIFLVEQEGTASSFRGLYETINAHWLFSSFYTDRGSHYFFTPKAGEEVDKERLTQVGRALRQLRSSISRPTARRDADAWSGFGGRCKVVCRHYCGKPASARTSRRPIVGLKRSTWRGTTPASRSRRPGKERPSSPSLARSRTFCAFRRSVSSITTIRCAMRAAFCKSRRRSIGVTS